MDRNWEDAGYRDDSLEEHEWARQLASISGDDTLPEPCLLLSLLDIDNVSVVALRLDGAEDGDDATEQADAAEDPVLSETRSGGGGEMDVR